MMRWMHFRIILISLIILISAVSGQLDETQKDIEETSKDLQDAIDKARGTTQAEYWENIGLQWKEFLLRNKFVSAINTFFTDINIVFLILFGMDWSISFNMFFAFGFWIIVFLSIYNYMKSVDKAGIGIIYSLVIVILLAQINLFEYLGTWSTGLIFYGNSIVWKVLTFIFLTGFCVGFALFHKSIANFLKRRKEEKEKRKEKKTKETFGKMISAAVEGAGSK